ncbi:hypothetical protein NXU91_05985 [Bacteroides ovatus]|nr:hypothetical protein [Bacteroides ovatus]MCS2297364.1 hypothetical protein [Bacteroides ovatus]
MDENFRFIQVLDELKEKGIITDYVQAANDLGTNKAGISDIKKRKKEIINRASSPSEIIIPND